MKAKAMKRALLLLGITAGACVHAQQAPAASCPPMSNVAQLSADGSVDVQQDVMRMTLSTSKQGSNANQVQKQLKQALDAALQLANAQAKPEALNVKTGNFNIYPSSNRNGQITVWQGSAELVLSGTDMARISAVADKIRTLTIANISFDMSKALRRKAEEQAQALAIADFRAKAQTIARSFGFSDYSLREVAVNANGNSNAWNSNAWQSEMRAMPLAANSEASDATLATQPGKTTVHVVVSGSVQMK